MHYAYFSLLKKTYCRLAILLKIVKVLPYTVTIASCWKVALPLILFVDNSMHDHTLTPALRALRRPVSCLPFICLCREHRATRPLVDQTVVSNMQHRSCNHGRDASSVGQGTRARYQGRLGGSDEGWAQSWQPLRRGRSCQRPCMSGRRGIMLQG